MKLARALALLVTAALAVAVVGCAGNQPQAPVTAVATATATATPSPPTATPTPLATATPTPADAAALLREAQSRQQAVGSARGLLELAVAGPPTTEGTPVSLSAEFAFVKPDDVHMKISGAGMPAGLQVEVIAKGDRTYLKAGERWLPLPAETRGERQSPASLVAVDELESYLAGASGLRIAGQRAVKGVECDVVAFSPAPAQLRELAALRGQTAAQRTLEEVTLEELQGEVAVGRADKLIHQMVVKMSGYEKNKPEARFRVDFAVSLWDFDAPAIVVAAPRPEDLLFDPGSPRPSPTPTPVPAPLHAYRSSSRPAVDGVVGPAEGWQNAEAVRGPYADGTIEIKALHDGKDLYLLLVWDETRYRRAEGLTILFEDGGSAPQGKLDGRHDDDKYVGVSGLPEGYRDAYWGPGWRVGEPTDGAIAGRHSAGKMVVEWRGPLSSGSETDVSVTGDETLGFAVVNWADGAAGRRGAWPPGAGVYEPATWGRLVVRYQAARP